MNNENKTNDLMVTNENKFNLSLVDRKSIEKSLETSMLNRELAEWEIACALYVMKVEQFYKKGVVNESKEVIYKAFNKFEQWAKETYDLAKSTAYQYADCFGYVADYKEVVKGEGKTIVFKHECFKDFTVTKIADLLPLLKKDSNKVTTLILQGEIKATMTRKELKDKVKELQSEVVIDADTNTDTNTQSETSDNVENSENNNSESDNGTNTQSDNETSENVENGAYTIIVLSDKKYRLDKASVSKLEKWLEKEKITVIE